VKVERPRGVIAGLIVLAIAVSLVLPPLGVQNAGAYLFVGIGAAFVAAHVHRSQHGWSYLLPGCTFLGFGVGLLIPTWFSSFDPKLEGPVLLGSQAIALVVCFIVKPHHWGVLVPAGILATVAGADAFLKTPLVPDALQPYFLPVMLVGVALYLLHREFIFRDV
jgi:hypothetical protein